MEKHIQISRFANQNELLEKQKGKTTTKKIKNTDDVLRKRESENGEKAFEEKRKKIDQLLSQKVEEKNLELVFKEHESTDRRKFYCITFLVIFCVALYFFIKLKIESKRDYIF